MLDRASNGTAPATTPVPSAIHHEGGGSAPPPDAGFGEVWKQIQSKYGAKPQKPREIKKTLDKDDFLRIMITQMRHQDPMEPFKAEQFATELAQFTSVEQMQNMNQSLNKMANQNHPLERMAMANLIGKTVTVDRERFPHTENTNSSLTFTIPKDAANVRIAIIAESGEPVLEKDLGPQKAGANSFNWDGIRSNTLPAKSGNYLFRVDAKDDKGQSLQTGSIGQAKVVGVSFEGNEPVFLIGDPARPDKVSMRNVVRIDADSGPVIPGAKPLANAVAATAPPAAQPSQGSSFISFQKGVGSGNLDLDKLSPEARGAIARYHEQQAQANAPVPNGNGAEVEKGFPNGLQPQEDEVDSAQETQQTEKGGEMR